MSVLGFPNYDMGRVGHVPNIFMKPPPLHIDIYTQVSCRNNVGHTIYVWEFTSINSVQCQLPTARCDIFIFLNASFIMCTSCHISHNMKRNCYVINLLGYNFSKNIAQETVISTPFNYRVAHSNIIKISNCA